LADSLIVSFDQILAEIFLIIVRVKHGVVPADQGICEDSLLYGPINIMFAHIIVEKILYGKQLSLQLGTANFLTPNIHGILESSKIDYIFLPVYCYYIKYGIKQYESIDTSASASKQLQLNIQMQADHFIDC
jgi:hypothetical protein